MCGTYKIDLYAVLISAVYGAILLLPVPVRHLKMLEYCCPHCDILICGE